MKISELTTKITELNIREFKKRERKLNKKLRKKFKREVVEDDVNTTCESENCVEKFDDNGNTFKYCGDLDQKLQPALDSEILAFQYKSPPRRSSPERMPVSLLLSPNTPPGLPPSLHLECQSVATLSSYFADETPDKSSLTPDLLKEPFDEGSTLTAEYIKNIGKLSLLPRPKGKEDY